MLDTLHEDRFLDRAPAAVYATLLEEGRYLCSIRTMYRVLHDADEVTERRPQRRHPHREPPRLVATAPNQVWTWDITRLPGPRKWVTYPLYVVLDLFSRYVVAWMVATRGNGDTSAAADHQCMPEAGHRARTTHPAPGSRCADDGQDVFPAAGRPGYPGQLQSAAGVRRPTRIRRATSRPSNTRRRTRVASAAPEDAQTYFRNFFAWYNSEHRHGGLGLLTPDAVHHGLTDELQATRQHVLDDAYCRHPERFANGRPRPPKVPSEVWINQPNNTIECDHIPQ